MSVEVRNVSSRIKSGFCAPGHAATGPDSDVQQPDNRPVASMTGRRHEARPAPTPSASSVIFNTRLRCNV